MMTITKATLIVKERQMNSKNDFDSIIQFKNSLIQYGKNSDRVYLMKLDSNENEVISFIEQLAIENDLGKIFTKVPETSIQAFLNNNYRIEAEIPNYFKSDKCYFASKFVKKEREFVSEELSLEIENNIKLAKSKASSEMKEFDSSIRIKVLDSKDLEKAAELYRIVFKSYPFPIFDASYLESTLDHIMYFGAFVNGQLVACSSSEMYVQDSSVEMTDFATLPDYLGKNISSMLLFTMENVMKANGINTSYTIARAMSKGMNITFAKNAYTFSGTLINNTDIFGKIESMNVWYKHL